MFARRSVALLIVCLVPLAASCGKDSKDAATGTTTTTAASATTKPAQANDGGTATTGSTTPQLSFADGVAQMNKNLDAAKGDVCALVKSLGDINVADPTTSDEAKQAVDVVAKYLDAMADAAPAQAAALHKAANDFRDEAKAANYDVSALSQSKVMSSAEVGTALSDATSKCTS